MSELNDPRVYFAAERNLLAWNRTSVALMAFGFVVERASLMLKYLEQSGHQSGEWTLPMIIGLGFIALGAVVALLSIVQFHYLLRGLRPVEIPESYWVKMAPIVNVVVALLGAGLVMSVFLSGP